MMMSLTNASRSNFILFPTIHDTHLWDNCIQNFHLGIYGWKLSFTATAVKCDLRTYIQGYTSPNDNFEYGYPNSNANLQSHPKLECCKLHKAARHPMKCEVINDTLFPIVYRMIFCCKFFDVIQSNVTLQKQAH